MGKRKNRGVIPGAPEAGEPDAPASPEPEPGAPAAAPAEPLGKLWTWIPDDVPPEVPLADRVADAIRDVEAAPPVKATDSAPVGVLWTWTPPAEGAAPPPPRAPAVEPEPVVPTPAPAAPPSVVPMAPVFHADVAPTPAPVGKVKIKAKRERRFGRKSEPPAAPQPEVQVEAAVVAPAPAAPLPVVAPVFQAAEVAPAPVAEPETELTTLRPVFTLDPDLVMPAPALLAPPVLVPQLDEPWLQVPPPSGAGRGVRLAVGALVLATCAALPWVVPQIPDLFAEAVPEQSGTPSLPQPTFAPPSAVPSGGVKVNKSLAGKRLASAGTPLEVTVERLQVIKAPVVPISGQTGELIPPDDPDLLGWWQEGAGVGAAHGTSIITGHTVSSGGGAFDHLGELVAGDQVTVRTAAGTIEYIVRETQDLPVAELAGKARTIFRQSGNGRLVLITCSDFDGKVYRSNSVVYASPLEDIPKRKK